MRLGLGGLAESLGPPVPARQPLPRVDPTQSSERSSVDTPSRGRGRVCGEVRIGQTGRSRAGGDRPMGTVSGERPIGAASFRQQSTQASCQTPPRPAPPPFRRPPALVSNDPVTTPGA